LRTAWSVDARASRDLGPGVVAAREDVQVASGFGVELRNDVLAAPLDARPPTIGVDGCS
jgi:hypothetical protein